MKMEGFVEIARRNFVPAEHIDEVVKVKPAKEVESTDNHVASDVIVMPVKHLTKPKIETETENVQVVKLVSDSESIPTTTKLEIVDPSAEPSVLAAYQQSSESTEVKETTVVQEVKLVEAKDQPEQVNITAELPTVMATIVTETTDSSTESTNTGFAPTLEVKPQVVVKAEPKSGNEPKVITKVEPSSAKYPENLDGKTLSGNVYDPGLLSKSVSKFSNKIKDQLCRMSMFETIKPEIRKERNIASDDFYKNIQNAIYHSLLKFLKIRSNSNSFEYFEDPGRKNLGTKLFLSRVFLDEELLNEGNIVKVMERHKAKYASNDKLKDIVENYNNILGIEDEWISEFVSRMKKKNRYISDAGINIISSAIEKMCCVPNVVLPGSEEVKKEEVINDPEEEVLEKKPVDEDDEDDDYQLITVDIDNDPETKYDTVSISGANEISWTFNVPDQGRIDLNTPREVHDSFDARNGIWNWLIHIKPFAVIQTLEPDKFMDPNVKKRITGIDEPNTLKMVIINHCDDIYDIGIYFVDPEILDTTDGDAHIKIVNYLVSDVIASTTLSHRNKTLATQSLYLDESVVIFGDENVADTQITSDKMEQTVIEAEDVSEEELGVYLDSLGLTGTPEDQNVDTSVVSIGKRDDDDDMLIVHN
jgi:ligand-binding sensor protein